MEQTINGGTTAELLEEMLANTPSPLKKRRSGNRLSHTNSSNSSNNNNNLDDSNGGGVLTNSGAVLSDMSLSHDFQDEEERMLIGVNLHLVSKYPMMLLKNI